ncbi:hypothetical protein Tco_1220553 [Tanacetum coccineum]
MVGSSSPDITPKEELVTLDTPESPNFFLPATQVDFTFDEITFTTNNEVALISPSYSNQEYFMDVSNFISKCCIKEAFTRAPNQYKEYLSELWYTTKVLPDSKIWVSTPTREVRGEIGIITFRNALRAQYLPHSSGKIGGLDQISNKDATILYCLANGVQVDYAKIIWEDLIHKLNKKTREKIVPYPRFISLLLEHMAPKYDNEELTINPTQAICNLDVLVDSKAPKYSSPTEEVPQGKKPGARSGLRRKQSSKHTSESTTEASKSQSGHSKKETKSSSAMDTSPSHPSPPTPVVGEMHKEAQQAAGGPTSLGDTSEDGAHPQLSSGSNPSVLVDKTKSARDGLKTTHTTSSANEESGADDISQKVKLEDLSDILKDTRSTFFTPDSPTDEPIIISDESEEKENAENDKDTEDTLVPPPSPKSTQIQELMAQVHLLQSQKDELEQVKVKAEAEVASIKSKPSYPDINQLTKLLITELSREIKELKQHIKDMEIELPGDLKEIPSKLETFTSFISSLSSQVTNTLNRFSTLVGNASGATATGVPSADKVTASPIEGEKDVDTNLKNELVDLLGIDIVTQYYNKKLLYEKYCEKMKKIRQISKIINYVVLTKKGPISLKVYREDGTAKVIEKFKASDLQLAKWREVVQACPDRKEKGWKTIYELIETRMEYLEQTEKELHIDFNKSLQEQDPLDELNDLASKKRKRTGDSTDHSRSSKKHKLSSST